MTRRTVVAGIAVLAFSASLFAADPVFSGSGEAKATFAVDDEKTAGHAFEQFANLRFKVEVGEKGAFHGAVNAIADSGTARELQLDGELERLYMEIRGDKIDFDAGLMRLAFGYGQGFRPTDVFALPNPLYPDARPQGVLGALLAWYPIDGTKVQGFAVNRPDQINLDTGLSADLHTRIGSLEGLYILSVPSAAGTEAVHRTGTSLKFDLAAGFTVDALYTSGTELPEIAAGIDYSLADGKVYLLGQYFFNGDDAGYAGTHYLLGTVSWQYSDYTNLTAVCTASPGDGSCLSSATLSHEPFQGFTVTLSGRMPLDKTSFGDGTAGEFGPSGPGGPGSVSLGARMKF